MAAIRSVARILQTSSTAVGRCVRMPAAASSAASYVGATRAFAQRSGYADASQKLVQTLQTEMNLEKRNYKEPEVVEKFLNNSNTWKFKENPGDVNMVLTREIEGKVVTVDFQLVSPFDGEEESANNDEGDMTDFSVTVESQDGSGITVYCTTLQKDDKFRYMIGNVRHFASAKEKELVSSYGGPEFEDLESSVQDALDEWLKELGVNDELCDFIDAMSINKEQKEYMNWLQSLTKFLEKP